MAVKNPTAPFYSIMMLLGIFGFIATFILDSIAVVEFFGRSWYLYGLQMWGSAAVFAFGFFFGLIAAVSARRGEMRRLRQEAAQAADELSASRSDTASAKAASSSDIPSSSALFSTPEPRVVVLDKVSQPRVEPSFSPKD